MRLHIRLGWIMALLVLLPGVPAAWMARQLVTKSLNLGLSSEIDAALGSGIRQSRDFYLHQRKDLADSLDTWLANASGGPMTFDEVARTVRESGTAGLPGDRVLLRRPDGSELVLRGSPTVAATMPAPSSPGSAPSASEAAPSASEAAPSSPEPRPSASEAAPPSAVPRPPSPKPTMSPSERMHASTEPPRYMVAQRALPDGSYLVARREMPEAWRQDGRTIAGALQAVRGLRAERQALERDFWLPFLAIYVLSLLAALFAANWLTRGIVGPVQRLFAATRAIGDGRWDVRVPVRGRDELAKLGEQFNDMVHRLDAQSRRLVDLETMAAWREMAQALAHEVQNPLTPIQLTVEAMRKRYHGDDRAYAALLEECSRIVVQEVESLRSLVLRFREFSRPVEPVFAPIDLNAIVADVGALQRDLRVELDLSAELGPIRADEDRLRQVLMNLARNAQTAASGRESPCLRLSTRPAGANVVLVVEDNGPGIPLAERERVFEPYRSGFTGGLGLGLALVKGIILVHGGSIRVEDGPWGGARFRITLPREPEVAHD